MREQGLTGSEARERLLRFGPNAVPDTAVHPLKSALGKFWAPVPWMLELAIGMAVLLRHYAEGGVIALLLTFNVALSFFQESRAEATLAALRSRLALMASVRRDGVWANLLAESLVPGDVVKLSLGAVVPADVRILEGSVLLDQSMLTGESAPIEAGAGLETYAGALVRRGEAAAIVTETGPRTRFGKTAELVRAAHVESAQQKVVLRVVRNLALFNVVIVLGLVTSALLRGLPLGEVMPLTLTAILMAVPVALPATFTLTAALGARALGRVGVLPTRLSAVDEAATMDVLCADKTGTLTQNELRVTVVRAMAGFEEAHVLGLSALASSEGGKDPVDAAIRAAAGEKPAADLPARSRFVPFDPATKMAEAFATRPDGVTIRIVKGAFSVVAGLVPSSVRDSAAAAADALARQGFRVLAVAAGPEEALELSGLIALSDPPRSDSAGLIVKLRALGVRTLMVTGDAPATAETVARDVGLTGAVCPSGKIPEGLKLDDFSVFAGVLPEDKYRLVQVLQEAGHTVGMCGDGVNDAPALRQAQMGIAVFTATDVAKSAAGIVLTGAGLGGIVASVEEGRRIFQRVLTYTLKSVTHKFVGPLFLAAGLLITGHAILTPLLLVISMLGGDFLSMLASTDNVTISPSPSVWRVGRITAAGGVLGFSTLAFCLATLEAGKRWLRLDNETLQTLAIVTLVFSGQAILYVVRERRRFWRSRPSAWLMLASAADVLFISTLAACGILMKPLPVPVIAGIFAAAALFGLLLDLVKVSVFRLVKIV